MLKKIRSRVITFLDSKKETPIIAAIAAGLYPLVYYYNENFSLVNSWSQFLYTVCYFILIPIISFYLIDKLFAKTIILAKWREYIISALNLSLFAFLLILITYGYTNKLFFLIILTAIVIGIILKGHLKKIVVFQLLLSLFVLVKLLPDFYRHFTYSSEWMKQSDNITEVVFKKKPNVYFIQPDGYANFADLQNDNYSFDNSKFETYLEENNFKLYQDFRSNYISTLSSNSSMFAMKHHYFHNPKPGMNELYNARDVIVGENPVVSIFKNNGYKTSLIIETPYLLINRPKIAFDYCNIKNSEVAIMANKKRKKRDVYRHLKNAIQTNKGSNHFYFIEKISPGHISAFKQNSSGKAKERVLYLEELKHTNIWLKKTIKLILEEDPNSLIVIAADHGGFVGLDYSFQSKEKQENDDLVTTVFTAALAIKWPEDIPDFDTELKTSVNLFRIILSYLSDNEQYLENLQADKSFTVIERGAPFGVYEVINEKDTVVFEKFMD